MKLVNGIENGYYEDPQTCENETTLYSKDTDSSKCSKKCFCGSFAWTGKDNYKKRASYYRACKTAGGDFKDINKCVSDHPVRAVPVKRAPTVGSEKAPAEKEEQESESEDDKEKSVAASLIYSSMTFMAVTAMLF